jgi:hypothetical protein
LLLDRVVEGAKGDLLRHGDRRFQDEDPLWFLEDPDPGAVVRDLPFG